MDNYGQQTGFVVTQQPAVAYVQNVQQPMVMVQTEREWTSGVCACFEDCGGCKYFTVYRLITSTRMFEPRHNILSNVRTNFRKYVVTYSSNIRVKVIDGTRTTLSGA